MIPSNGHQPLAYNWKEVGEREYMASPERGYVLDVSRSGNKWFVSLFGKDGSLRSGRKSGYNRLNTAQHEAEVAYKREVGITNGKKEQQREGNKALETKPGTNDKRNHGRLRRIRH